MDGDIFFFKLEFWFNFILLLKLEAKYQNMIFRQTFKKLKKEKENCKDVKE